MQSSITDMLPSNIATVSNVANPRGNKDLGQEDFLELMLAQLQNQDPTNPADGADFLSQIAEFSVVEGIADLSTGFDKFVSQFAGSQTLDAANLVGRQVMTENNLGYLAEEGELDATLDMPGQASSVRVYVQDENGALVNQIDLGPRSQGYESFTWDGTNANGDALAEGKYRVSAEAVIDGRTQSIPVYTHNQVESVVLDKATGNYELKLANGSSAGLTEVLGIFQ